MTFKPAHLLVVLLAVAIPAMAENIAVVNGKAISSAKMDVYISQAKAQGQPDTPELRAKIKEHLIGLEALMQEATKYGIPDKSDIKAQIEGARQQIIVGTLMREYVAKNPVSDADILAFYNAEKAKTGDKEYHAFHILVKTEDEAKAIIAKLKAGAKFDELAKQSIDPGSAAKGGDLDWAPPGAYVPEFGAALQALKKGQFTETPVKSQFGFHVIKLDDTRTATFPELADIKQRIAENLAQQKVHEYEQSIISKAKVTSK